MRLAELRCNSQSESTVSANDLQLKQLKDARSQGPIHVDTHRYETRYDESVVYLGFDKTPAVI
jgi:hypothetical protein